MLITYLTLSAMSVFGFVYFSEVTYTAGLHFCHGKNESVKEKIKLFQIRSILSSCSNLMTDIKTLCQHGLAGP